MKQNKNYWYYFKHQFIKENRHSNKFAYLIIIAMTVLSFILSSCEKNEPYCECEATFVKDDGNEFEIRHLPLDCETGYPIEEHQFVANGHFIKCNNKK